MSKKTRIITLSALFSALSVVVLYFSSVWPTGQFGLAAVASLFVAAAIVETGIVSGIYVFVIASALSMLILPNKSSVILFMLFFGYYPIIRNLAEKIPGKILGILIKLVVFNAALCLIWLFFEALLPVFEEVTLTGVPLHLCGSVVFVVFDYGYSKVILYYMQRIHRDS